MSDTYVMPLLKIVVVLNAMLVARDIHGAARAESDRVGAGAARPDARRPYGALQPIADAIKLMLKEDITPARADRWVFTAGADLAMVPALIAFAVIPFGGEATSSGAT